ncbi:hypothetical protein H4R19_004825, partial [Coemansia spiralis]
MLPRSTTGVACLAVGAYWLLQLATCVRTLATDDLDAMCSADGRGRWSWSLRSDCFRERFLWPALLAATGASVALALALRLLHPTGLPARPVRRPPGAVVLVDNRMRTGTAVAAATAVQAALAAAWWRSTQGPCGYPLLLAQTAALAAGASVACLAAHARNKNRVARHGLFPRSLPALAAVQLAAGLCEMHASFFAPGTATVPIWGPH